MRINGIALALLIAASETAGHGKEAFVLTTGSGSQRVMSMKDLPRSGWLGLFDDEKGTRIESVEPHVTEKTDAHGYKNLALDSKPAGAFLLFNNVPGLRTGPAEMAQWVFDTAGDNSDGTMKPGQQIDLALGNRRYRLSLITSSRTRMDNARLVLETGGQQQTLYTVDGEGDEPHFAIYFAGDLDADEKLDLIVTMSPKYSWYPRSVLLSSAAGPDEIVREVARFDDAGC